MGSELPGTFCFGAQAEGEARVRQAFLRCRVSQPWAILLTVSPKLYFTSP